MKLTEKIKSLCEGKGETIASLERKMDFGNGTIRRWDEKAPAADRLAKVADYFNVTTDYLLDRKAEEAETDLDCAFFRLKKGLEPLGLDEDDADFLLTVYKAHKEKNK